MKQQDDLLLAREGAKVAVTDIADEEGGKVIEEIQKIGGVAKYWHIDTSNEADVISAFSNIASEFGSIDILVNNAGIAGVNLRELLYETLLSHACRLPNAPCWVD